MIAYLMRASTEQYFRTVGDIDLSLTQIKILHLLERHSQAEPSEGLSPKKIGEFLPLSLPAVSRALDGLYKRELIERQEDEQDRRMKRVRINAQGSHKIEQLVDTRIAQLEELAASLTEPQRRKLREALAPLVARDEIAHCRKTHETKD